MSLLDDVSIVVTPNGYKAGELYAVVPVPTEGADVIVDGNFPDGSTAWALNGWTISGNAANCSGITANLIQTISGSTKKQFLITFTISNYVSGSVIPAFVGGNPYSKVYNANGTFTEVISSYSDTRFVFYATSFDGSISNVSVKEYTAADMDVTRATAATRVDEAGLVNYAEIIGSEEVTNGDFATDSDWGLGTGWTISGGSANSSGSNEDAYLSQSNMVIGKTYKVTFDVNSYTSGALSVRVYGESQQLLVNSTGSYSVLLTPSVTTLLGFRSAGGSGGYVGSIDNVSVKEVTRDNVPRIDYTGGGCPHILAEPQRTNLVTYSETFSDSSWTKLGAGTGSTAVVTSDYAISPDGTQNATRLVCDLNGGGGSVSNQSLIYDLYSSSGDQSLSIYVKSNTGSNQTIYFANTQTSGDTIIATNEWQRFTFSHSTTNYVFAVGLRGRTGGAIDDTADILIWGGQAESGSFPTSYIPTSGSTVTRNQDQFTRDGISSLINSTEGVLFIESIALSDDEDTRISISDGTGNNYISIGYSRFSGNIIAEIFAGGVLQTVGWGATGVNKLINHKFALSWGSGTMNFYMDGSISNTESVTSPTGMNVLKFSTSVGANFFYGKVKQLQVYSTALSDEQLIQLTGTSGTDFYESYAEMASALTYTIQ